MQSSPALTTPYIQLHQQAMCRLVQAIQHQPAPGIGNSRFKITGGAITLHKPLKRTAKITAQAVGLKELPIAKARTIPEAETRQKIIIIQRHRLAERGPAGRTRLRSCGRM